jgi:trehalose synthase
MKNGNLERYRKIVGAQVIDQLHQLVRTLKGIRVVHVNSTRAGGGVAEILNKLVPLKRELGIDVSWEVVEGDGSFFQCTKSFHNALQGDKVEIPPSLLKTYEETNETNARRLRPVLEEADIVFIHDPQPAALLSHCTKRRGKWIWRCHIDVSQPYRPVWKYLRRFIEPYDASVFSLAAFAQQLPHVQYLIPPSIDPLSEKNVPLESAEVESVVTGLGVDPGRPMMLQVSRFDRFKDPVGVIQAFRLTKKFVPSLQLVLAGGEAADDPESQAVLDEVRVAANGDPNIHILLLPADAHRTINALQRSADIVLQKSIREGFGLTVTEALWKSKPVIGGDTGGIRIQVVNHHTGFLVRTPAGAALRARYLLFHRDKLHEMGGKGHRFVRDNFLLTRHLREYLTLMVTLIRGRGDRMELA